MVRFGISSIFVFAFSLSMLQFKLIDCSMSSGFDFTSSTPPIARNQESLREGLLSLMQHVQATITYHTNDQPEACLESLRTTFTIFKSKFGDKSPEAMGVLSVMLLGDNSKQSPEYNKLGYLMYNTAKEFFGPTHLYSLTILQHLAANFMHQRQLDKALQLNLVLANILKTHHKSNPESAEIFLRTLQNLSEIYIIQRKLPEGVAIADEIVNFQKSRFGLSAPETKASLVKFVKLIIFALTQGAEDRRESLFQMVKTTLKVPLTDEDFERIIKASDIAELNTPSNPAVTFQVFRQFLTMKYTKIANGETNWDLNTKGTVPLKFEEEIYELLFIIQQLILASCQIREGDPVYEMYLQITKSTGKRPTENGGSSSGIPKMDPNEQAFWIADEQTRSIAQVRKAVGVQHAKDVLKRTEKTFGKKHERTKGIAEIIASLYSHVGIVEEAKKLREKFQENITGERKIEF